MSRTKRQVPPHITLRHPKTFAERKASLAAVEDGVPFRPKRNKRHLPSDYDDKIIQALYEKVEKKA